MEPIKLSVEPRSETGSAIARRLRVSGRIPAVVYTSGRPAKQLSLATRDYNNLISKASVTQFFNFESEDKQLNGLIALVRDIQREPIKSNIHHIDFLEVEAGHKIRIAIPIQITGESPYIKQGLGMIAQNAMEVEVECMPKDIPANLVLDISGLTQPGQSLNAGNLVLPENVDLRTDDSVNIVTLVSKQAVTGDLPEDHPAPVAAEAATPEAGKDAKKADSAKS